ncbi:MAG: hypothetical protein IKE65_05870, partial [Clostridia bacterium]|nr:hypothetical protein [Clostridia bacterium]
DLIAVLSGKESFQFHFEIFPAIGYMMFTAFLIIALFILYVRNRLNDSDKQMFMVMLCIVSIYGGVFEFIWVNQYCTDPILVLFPLVFTTVVIFKEYSFMQCLLKDKT